MEKRWADITEKIVEVKNFRTYFCTDFITPFGIVAIVADFNYRRQTGKGQYFDKSQYGDVVPCMAPLILDYIVSQRVANRMGNRFSFADSNQEDYLPSSAIPDNLNKAHPYRKWYKFILLLICGISLFAYYYHYNN